MRFHRMVSVSGQDSLSDFNKMPSQEPLPPLITKNAVGTYMLVIHFDKKMNISVGRFGVLSFRRGYYLYVGSAFGPGGLCARIGRHLRHTKRHHWHIDYLASKETIADVWFSSHKIRHECSWADRLRAISDLKCPVTGFGSSDCSCPSHFFYSRKKPSVTSFQVFLGEDLKRLRVTDFAVPVCNV